MTELVIQRALPVELEPTGDGWTLYGRAVPYNVDQDVTDDGKIHYLERFAPGAFARDAGRGAHWVNLFVGHSGDDGDRYLGRCIDIQDRQDGLYTAFRVNREHPLAEEARSGELTRWSVSAHVYRTRMSVTNGRDVAIREHCGLSHVAATARPQYQGAGVLVARDHQIITDAAPIRDQYRKRLDLIRTR